MSQENKANLCIKHRLSLCWLTCILSPNKASSWIPLLVFSTATVPLWLKVELTNKTLSHCRGAQGWRLHEADTGLPGNFVSILFYLDVSPWGELGTPLSSNPKCKCEKRSKTSGTLELQEKKKKSAMERKKHNCKGSQNRSPWWEATLWCLKKNHLFPCPEQYFAVFL